MTGVPKPTSRLYSCRCGNFPDKNLPSAGCANCLRSSGRIPLSCPRLCASRAGEGRSGCRTACGRRILPAQGGTSRTDWDRVDGLHRQPAGGDAGGDSGSSEGGARARPRHDPGAVARGQAGVHGGGGRHERQPGVHRQPAAGLSLLPHRTVQQGPYRRHHAD